MLRTALFLVASLSVACTTSPRIVGQDTQVLETGRLASVNPADVAIAPVELLYADLDVPAEALRRSAARALVVRRYSPLALERIDENVVEAAYSPGSLREDAVLHIVVRSWDSSLWSTRRTLQVDLEARLLDARDPAGQPLWAGQLTERVDLTGEQSQASSEATLTQRATDLIMKELLAVLPARDPQPGPVGG